MAAILTLHDPAQARRYYEEGTWAGDTLYSLLLGHATGAPQRFALRDGRYRLTYAALLDWVDTLAERLRQAGARPGCRVSVWLPNRVEAVVVLLACSRNGYVCNPSLHQNYTVAEILALLTRLESFALFAQPGYGADAQPPARNVPDIFEQALAVPGLRRVFRLSRLPDLSGGADDDFPPPQARAAPGPAPSANPDQVVYIAFTSGTTGAPKGVMHSDNTLLANARAMVADWRLDARTVILTLSPLSHHIATVGIAQALVAGAELVVNAPPPGQSTLDWVHACGATYVMGVPTHAIDLLAQLRTRGETRLGDVKTFYMAGSPIPVETARAFLELGITPQNVYGMTENGSHQYTLPSDDARTITETCGRAAKGYEVRIWDQVNPDVEVEPGQVGEVGGRGALLMLGYFGEQAITERSFNAEGWFMSGDLGILDRQGCLRIVGRKKDLIIRGGHNIHPAHIENLAMRHPAVLKAAAFPVADARLGERVCLAVIPATGWQVQPEQLLEHLQQAGLSPYDLPEYFIAMDEFPLTASGKILKRELTEWAKSGRIRPTPVRRSALAAR
ncbi:MAG TPA: class I adenylate-forming enzyme family protein, partial [bacterium]|nr:class I adenylate-forming enzyme family protein [bacterium]